MKTNKVIFLDRDGVINKEKNYLYKIEDFQFIDGVFDSLYYLTSLGYKLIIVSNQSGIGRGFYSINQFNKLNEWMLEKFSRNNISFLDVLICPHTDEDNCNCRKPKPGLIIDSAKKYEIDLLDSFLIGDSERDIIAAKKSGIKTTILVRSGHKIDEKNTQANFVIDSIKDINEIIK